MGEITCTTCDACMGLSKDAGSDRVTSFIKLAHTLWMVSATSYGGGESSSLRRYS